jgi:hypothetical protein
VPAGAAADARTEFLVETLQTSTMFRVRAQAAVSLGNVEVENSVVEALSAALGDAHPAVRAAAAASLERLSAPGALAALRRAESDADPEVRSAVQRAIRRIEPLARAQGRGASSVDVATADPARSAGSASVPEAGGTPRFYVAAGRPGSAVPTVSAEMLDGLHGFVERHCTGTAGVLLAPRDEAAGAAQRVLRERRLVGFYLDTSVVSLENLPTGGVRGRVSVLVQSYPERNIRSMLSGGATVPSGSGPSVERMVLEGAMRGALRGLAGVMEAVAASESATTSRRR